MNDKKGNPDFEDWSNEIPDGWYMLNTKDKLYNIIDNLVIRRIYQFNILGIRFTMRGRNLLKIKYGKKYIVDWIK